MINDVGWPRGAASYIMQLEFFFGKHEPKALGHKTLSNNILHIKIHR
jgi:hypothetical protein